MSEGPLTTYACPRHDVWWRGLPRCWHRPDGRPCDAKPEVRPLYISMCAQRVSFS